MNDPRCSRTGLLLFILYITSSGLLQCVSSSYSSNNCNTNYGLPGPVSPVTSDPWSQQYITNPNMLFKTKTPTEIANQHIHCLSPEEKTMTQVERIALKKTPGNYMYPEIPHPHKTPVHACLAGYDGEIFDIIKDIKETNGDEIEVHFYLFHRCKFNLLSSHMTTVKALQDVLTKYHHYICLNKKYVETYKAKEHCWYIEKLIMIPSFNHNFKSLPRDMKFDDFNEKCSEPLVLRTEEKVNPGENIKKIEEYENRYELTLHDLSGMAHDRNAAANLNRVCCPTQINKYIPNLLPDQVNTPTAIQPLPILPVKEELNLSNRNNQILLTSNSYGAYTEKSSAHNQARSYTQSQGQNNILSPSSFYAEHGTSQKSAGTVARYIHPPKSVAAYYTVPSYTTYSNTEAPYQMPSSYVTSHMDAKQRQNIKSYCQPSCYQQNDRILGLNALPKPSNEKVVLGQTVQRYPTGVSYTQSGENLIHGNWESQRTASAGYQTQPTVTFSPICKEKHEQASYIVSQSQFQPNYVTPYYSKSQNYHQQSYNQISSPCPKVQIWPTSNFVTTNRNFQHGFCDKLPQMTLKPDYNVVPLKPNEIKNEEISFSLHSHAHVSNSPSSGLNIFYSPQPNVVNYDKTDILNEINAYSPKKLVNPEYTIYTSSKVNPTMNTPLVCNVKQLNNFVSPITQNIVNIPKYTQPLKGADTIQECAQPFKWAQPQKYKQLKYQPISVPSSLNIVPLENNNRLVQATYQPRSSCIMTPKIWSPPLKLYTPKYEVQSVEYSKPSTPIISGDTTVYSSNKMPWYSTHLNKKLPDCQSIPFYSPIQNDLSPKTHVNQINDAFDSNIQETEPQIQPHIKSGEKYNTISTYTPRSVVKPTFNVDNVVPYTNNNNMKQSIISNIGNTDNINLKWPYTVVAHPSSKSYLQALTHVNINQPAHIQIPYLPTCQNIGRVWPNYKTIRPITIVKASYLKPELNQISSYTPKIITSNYNTISTQATIQELETPQFQTIASYRPAQKSAPGYNMLPYTPLALNSQMWSRSTIPKYKWPTKASNSINSYTKTPIKLENDVISLHNPSAQYNQKYDNIPSCIQPLYNTGTQQYTIPTNIQPIKSTQAVYPSTSSYIHPQTYKHNVISSYTPAIKIKTPLHKLEVTSELLPNDVESALLMPRPTTVAENFPSTVCSPSRLNYKQNVATIPYCIPKRETLERGLEQQFPTEKLSYEPSQKFVSPDHGIKINYRHPQTTKTSNLNFISSYTQPLAPIPDSSPVPFTSPQNIWNKPNYETISNYTPYRSNAPVRVEPISYFKPVPNIVSLGPITVTTSPQNQPKYEQATILTPNIAICKPRVNTFKLLAPKSQPVFNYHHTNSIPNYKQHQNYFTHKIPSWGSLTPVVNQGTIAPTFDPNLNVISSYTSQFKPNIVTHDVPQNIVSQSSQTPTLDFNKIEAYTPTCQRKDTSISSQIPFERQPSFDAHAPTQNQFRQICNTISAYTPRKHPQRADQNRPVAYTQQSMNVIPKYSTIAVDIPEVKKPEHGKISYTYTPIYCKNAKNIEWQNYQPEYGTKAMPSVERVKSSNVINSLSKVVKPNIYNQPLNMPWRAGPIYQPVQAYKLQKFKYPDYDMINAYTRPKQVINQGSDSLKESYPVQRPTQPLQVHVDSKPRNEQTILQPEYDMLSLPKLPQVVKPKYDEIRFYSPKKPDTPSYRVLTPDALRPHVSSTVISYTPHLKTIQRTSPTEYTQVHYTPTQTTNLHEMQEPRNDIDVIQSFTSKPDIPTGVTSSRTSINPNILQPLSQIRENNVQPPDNTKQHFNEIPCYTKPQSYIRSYKPKHPGKSNKNHFSVLPISQIFPSSHLLEGIRPCVTSLSPQNHELSSKTPGLISIPSYTPRPTLTRPHLVSIPSSPMPTNVSPDFVTVSPLNPKIESPDALVSITSYTKPPSSDSYLKLPYTPINNIFSIPSYNPIPSKISPDMVSISTYTPRPISVSPKLNIVIPKYTLPVRSNIDILSSYTSRQKSTRLSFAPISSCPNNVLKPVTINARPTNIQQNFISMPKYTPMVRPISIPINPYAQQTNEIPSYSPRPTNKIPNMVTISSYTQSPTRVRPDFISIPSYSAKPISSSPDLITITPSIRTPASKRPKSYTQPLQPTYIERTKYENVIPSTPSYCQPAAHISTASSIPRPHGISSKPDGIPWYTKRPNTHQPYTQIPYSKLPKLDVISSYRKRPDLSTPSSYQPDGKYPCYQRPSSKNPYTRSPSDISPELNAIPSYSKRPDNQHPLETRPVFTSASSYRHQPNTASQHVVSMPSYTQESTKITPTYSLTLPCAKRPEIHNPVLVSISPKPQHKPITPKYDSIRYSTLPNVNVMPFYTKQRTSDSRPCFASYPKSKSTQTINYAPEYVHVPFYSKPQIRSTGNWITKGITPDFYQIKSCTRPHVPSPQIPLISTNLHQPSLKSFNQIEKYTPYLLPSQVSSKQFIPSVQPYNQIESYTKPCIPTLQPIKLPEQLYSPSEQPYNQIGSYTKPCVSISQPVELPEQLYSPLEQPYNQIGSYTKPCVPTLQTMKSPEQLYSPSEQPYNQIGSYTKPCVSISQPVELPEQLYSPLEQPYNQIGSYTKPSVPTLQTMKSPEQLYSPSEQLHNQIGSYTKPCVSISQPVKLPEQLYSPLEQPYNQIGSYTKPCVPTLQTMKSPEQLYSPSEQPYNQIGSYTKPCAPTLQPSVPSPQQFTSSTKPIQKLFTKLLYRKRTHQKKFPNYNNIPEYSNNPTGFKNTYHSFASYQTPNPQNYENIPFVSPNSKTIISFEKPIDHKVQYDRITSYISPCNKLSHTKPYVQINKYTDPQYEKINSDKQSIPQYIPYTKPCIPSMHVPLSYQPPHVSLLNRPSDPCVSQSYRPRVPCVPTSNRPIKPCVPLSYPSQAPPVPLSYGPYEPCVSQSYRSRIPGVQASYRPWEPCVPTSNGPIKPCMPSSIPSQVPPVPLSYRTSEPCVPSSIPSRVPPVPLSYRPCEPYVSQSYQSRVPGVQTSYRLRVPCVPTSNRPIKPCVPLSYPSQIPPVPLSYRPYEPFVPNVSPSNRPSEPCVPVSYQPRIPYASNRPSEPCVSQSYQSRVPSVQASYRPWEPCVPLSYPSRVPPVPLSYRPSDPCVPQSYRSRIPGVQASYRPWEPCVPTSNGPIKPCMPLSYPSQVPPVPLLYQPYETSVPTSNQPCIPCVLTSNQPIKPCVPVSYQSKVPSAPISYRPCEPCVPTSNKPCIPYVSPSNRPSEPCVPLSYRPCEPCVPQSYRSRIPGVQASYRPWEPCVLTSNRPYEPSVPTSNRPIKPCMPLSYPSQVPPVPLLYRPNNPCVSTSNQPRVSSAPLSYRPSDPWVPTSNQPCIPWVPTSNQPCIPCVPTSNQPCIPYVPPSNRPREPCVPVSYQPKVPSAPLSYRPCEPCESQSYRSRVPGVQASYRPCVTCVPTSNGPIKPCVPLSYPSQVPLVPLSYRTYEPCVPNVSPSNRPSEPCVPLSYRPCEPCVPTSNQPCVPCVPTSNQPCIPYVSPSNRPSDPCVPVSYQSKVPSAPPSYRPCEPCVPQSYRPCEPCVPQSNQPCKPCVPSSIPSRVPPVPLSFRPSDPCVPQSYRPCVPCVPASNQPCITNTQPSYQPCIPCVPQSYRPCVPCVPTSNQPCLPNIQPSYQPCIPSLPNVPVSYHSRVPCVPLSYKPQYVPSVPPSYRPCIPCVPLLYQPRVPCIQPTYQHVPCTPVPNMPCAPSIPHAPIPYQGISWAQQQPKNTIKQDFDNVLISRTPEFRGTLRNGQHNNMRNETKIDVNSLKKCLMNTILKGVKGINCLKNVIPLDSIVLGVVNKLKDKIPFCSRCIDPNVELRGFMKKVKILKPKLVFETEEIDIPNFVPVVKCHDERHPDSIQNMAVNFVKSTYKNPLVINKTHPSLQPFVTVKNLDISPDRPLIWPAVCEFGNGYQRCSR